MKRIKAACICQTLHFQLKEDLEHSIAVRLVREKGAPKQAGHFGAQTARSASKIV